VSVLLAAHDREQIAPIRGWALEGLVYAPTSELPARAVGLALASMIRSHERIPFRRWLRSIPGPIQPPNKCSRCCAAQASGQLTDTLLVGTCNGR
jgi:hypothetical protein